MEHFSAGFNNNSLALQASPEQLAVATGLRPLQLEGSAGGVRAIEDRPVKTSRKRARA